MSESALSVSQHDPEADVLTSPSPLPPLSPGTTLLDRFTVIELLDRAPAQNTYRVAHSQPCPNCGVENEGSAQTCGFCGSELPAPRTMLLLERPLPEDGQRIPTSFISDGLAYAVAPDSDLAFSGQSSRLQQTYSYATDPGLVRNLRGDPNEDSVLALQLAAQHSSAASDLALYIIADGVGGATAGEIASRIAVETISHTLVSTLLAPSTLPLSDKDIFDALCAAVQSANTSIIQDAQTRGVSMGTTVTLALVRDHRAYFANVGDSRIYLFRENILTQITRDHSFVAQLVELGEISPADIRTHPQRNLILRGLGDESGFEIDTFPADAQPLELRPGDQLLLCSDGLWEMVEDHEIVTILEQDASPAKTCAALVSYANAAGGADNISTIVVRFNALP